MRKKEARVAHGKARDSHVVKAPYPVPVRERMLDFTQNNLISTGRSTLLFKNGFAPPLFFLVPKVRCRHLSPNGRRVSMFRAAFHTGYVPCGVLRLTKQQLDGACADDRFHQVLFLFVCGVVDSPVDSTSSSLLLLLLYRYCFFLCGGFLFGGKFTRTRGCLLVCWVSA